MSSFRFTNIEYNQGRTESFSQNLDNTEFKKEQKKMTQKEIAKLSIT